MEPKKKWKSNGLPRKGWRLVDVIDLGDDLTGGLPGTCEWCGTPYRYECIIEHSDGQYSSTCGRVCCEHLTDDYVTPRLKENQAKQNSAKKRRKIISEEKRRQKLREDWLWSGWKTSKKGNLYRFDPVPVIIFYQPNGTFKLKIADTFGSRDYLNYPDAQIAAYDYLFKKGKFS